MVGSHTKTLLVISCAGIALGVYLRATRRPDLTEPAEILKLPPDELRDAEVECLIRAAFANARSVHIHSEAAPSITVRNAAILSRLSKEFAVGHDAKQLPMYRHPGLEYTVITFDGQFTPRIGLTGPKDAMLMVGKPGHWRNFGVRTKFAQSLAELLGLELAEQQPPVGR